MKTLVMDTSSKYLYVSFLEDGQVFFNKFIEGKNNHSDNLLKVIEEGLNLNNLKVKDFDRIIVGIGPGSYTGLRVSVTVAKMFSYTLNIPLFIVSSLDLLASGYFNNDGIYAVTMLAKKSHVYGKLVEVKDNKLNVIIDDSFMTDEEFFGKINNYNYILINENNYKIDINNINYEEVVDLHQLTPNYIQREI